MAVVPYQTIPVELVEVAESAEAYFRGMGFALSIEKKDVGFPRTPAFVAKRGSTTLVVEVATIVSKRVCDDWAFYAKSCTRDTRVAFCVPRGKKNFEQIADRIRQHKMGLYRTEGPEVEELNAPHDLTVMIELPLLTKLPHKLRKKLGPAYEKFRHGHWQEGFEDICLIYEQDSRRYLRDKILAGHLNIVDKNGVIKNPTRKQIDKLTVGGLAKAYGAIQFPTPATAMVAQVLTAINRDRIGVVHKKGERAVEERLKRNVNGNIWKVVNGLRQFPK